MGCPPEHSTKGVDLSKLRHAPHGLVVGPFVELPNLVVYTLLKARPQSYAFEPLRPDFSSSVLDLDAQIRNAAAIGIAHVSTAVVVESLGLDQLAVCRYVTHERRTGSVEVAVLADLDRQLHIAGPDCFEYYEFLPTGILLTPDLDVREQDSSRTLICAYATDVSTDDHGHEPMLRITCSGSAGGNIHADYPLARLGT